MLDEKTPDDPSKKEEKSKAPATPRRSSGKKSALSSQSENPPAMSEPKIQIPNQFGENSPMSQPGLMQEDQKSSWFSLPLFIGITLVAIGLGWFAGEWLTKTPEKKTVSAPTFPSPSSDSKKIVASAHAEKTPEETPAKSETPAPTPAAAATEEKTPLTKAPEAVQPTVAPTRETPAAIAENARVAIAKATYHLPKMPVMTAKSAGTEPLDSILMMDQAFSNKEYWKASQLAKAIPPAHAKFLHAREILGHSLFFMKKYREAAAVFGGLANVAPESMAKDAEWFHLLCLLAQAPAAQVEFSGVLATILEDPKNPNYNNALELSKKVK